MSYVEAYTKCDICGKRIEWENWKYRIHPRSAVIRKYVCNEPYSRCFSKDVDICDECWKEMKDYLITVMELYHKKENKNG